jgi:Cdc6-like AAA superfamily ATPase
MISAQRINNEFVGPRALFDQTYIPPKILHRKTEEKALYSILKDSLHDEFQLNILFQGIQGIGKKVIVNSVLNDISTLNPELIKIQIDCSEKSVEEILVSLIAEVGSRKNINFDYKSFLNSSILDLWNLFKLICRKIDHNITIVFNNIEHIPPEAFKKFLKYGKENKINVISTGNQVLRSSILEIMSEFDFKKKLDYFSFSELNDIIKQRISLAFKNEIDNELIDLITDLIFEHHVPVPGKGIEILRELYPVLNQKMTLKKFEIYDILQNQFDTLQITDEFSMVSYISESDLLNLIFLDNLSNFFLKRANLYITIQELRELYYVTCESIEYEKNIEEFKHLIVNLRNIGILNASKKNNVNNFRYFNDNVLNYDNYFMVINPKQLKPIMDAIFTKH